MDIQILEQERMSQSGKSLINLMQAGSVERLDLLVRESVQNSLDASLRREAKTRVNVDFLTGDFKSRELNSKLKYISNQLDGRYPAEKYQFIAIKDSNTHGLTGTNEKTDVNSRLQSLVYHISKMQAEEGSGGSWGLGKTTFFKIGMGLVVYYSRTFEDGTYKSKLAATLVEDEDDNPLVIEEDSRGISFFGKYNYSIDSPNIRSETIPISDESYIKEFLKIFDIDSYKECETGTTVIIPYVNYDVLLSEVKPIRDGNEDYRDPVWVLSIEDYFKIALQRWYFPRLANPEFVGSWLKACVNGNCISRENMHPLFLLYQGLYNITLDIPQTSELLNGFEYERIEIRTNRVEGQIAGYVSATYVDINDLNLTNENYRNIYSYVGRYDATLGSPIVTFTRNAGMLVRYDTENSKWAPKFENNDKNKALVAIFRLASDKTLKDGSSLEEYVRASEKSVHNNWEDHKQQDIIARLSENTSKKLRDAFFIKDIYKFQVRSNLSRLFADMFLPKLITTISTVPDDQSEYLQKSNRSSRKRQKSGPGSSLDIKSSVLQNDSRIIEFYIRSDSLSNTAEIYFEVSSERGSVSHYEWETEFNTEFPLSIVSFELSDPSFKSKDSDDYTNGFNFLNTANSFSNCIVIAKKSERGAVYSMYIQSERPGFEFIGRLAIKSDIQFTSFEIKHASPGEY